MILLGFSLHLAPRVFMNTGQPLTSRGKESPESDFVSDFGCINPLSGHCSSRCSLCWLMANPSTTIMNIWRLRQNPVAFLNPVALIPMALEPSMQNPCNPCEQKLWRDFPVGIEELVGRLGSLLLVKSLER